MAQAQIIPLSAGRVQEAINFIIHVIRQEIEPETSFADLKTFFEERHEFDDIKNYGNVYSKKTGAYYLLVDNNKIIGQGAILKSDDKTAEIRRLYVSNQYRKTRASYSLIKKLLDYCTNQNIEVIRAEIFSEEKQQDVVKLCFNKGCYRIPAYKRSDSDLFVEFNLKNYQKK